MARIVLLVLCATLLASSVQGGNRGKIMQRLQDQPCATPMECYAQVIKALDEAEQEILSLYRTMTANQVQVNANIQGLKADMSANVNSITTSMSTSIYPCNCRAETGASSICSSGRFSAGFNYYCPASHCSDAWTPVLDTATGTGIMCCEVCSGTAAEAEAYALANPVPPSRSI